MAGGLALLPSCLRHTGKSSIMLHKIDISLDQENLLAEIAETLIPRTHTPGAKELKLHLFVLKMVDDCCSKKDQSDFIKGMEQFKEKVTNTYSKSFEMLSLPQKVNFLAKIQQSNDTSAALTTFYKILKDRTIDGYLNSKFVMTNLIVYELVPGRYNGYFHTKTA